MKKAARLIVFASTLLPLAGVCDTAAERERRTDEIAAWLQDEPRADGARQETHHCRPSIDLARHFRQGDCDGVQDMTRRAVESVSFSRRRGGRLCPRCRAVDRAAMRSDGEHFWKLAFCRKIPGNVPALCGVESEVGWTLTGIEHDCPPFEFVAHEIERCDEIRIAGDDDKCVGCVCVGVMEKRSGEIYIRPLFFDLYHMNKSVCGCRTFLTADIDGRNPCLVLVVVALDDIHSAVRAESLKVDVLSFNRRWVVRICLGAGGEVLDGCKLVVFAKMGMIEHGSDKRGDVKPFAVGMSAQQSVIEIAAVDVGDSLHLHSIKKIGPQTLRSKTLFRVGRTLRLDMNLLRGSVHIVPNRGFLGKGADLKNQTKENL